MISSHSHLTRNGNIPKLLFLRPAWDKCHYLDASQYHSMCSGCPLEGIHVFNADLSTLDLAFSWAGCVVYSPHYDDIQAHGAMASVLKATFTLLFFGYEYSSVYDTIYTLFIHHVPCTMPWEGV